MIVVVVRILCQLQVYNDFKQTVSHSSLKLLCFLSPNFGYAGGVECDYLEQLLTLLGLVWLHAAPVLQPLGNESVRYSPKSSWVGSEADLFFSWWERYLHTTKRLFHTVREGAMFCYIPLVRCLYQQEMGDLPGGSGVIFYFVIQDTPQHTQRGVCDSFMLLWAWIAIGCFLQPSEGCQSLAGVWGIPWFFRLLPNASQLATGGGGKYFPQTHTHQHKVK